MVLGLIFVGALLLAQWPFASFQMTEYARNWFFGAHYYGYYVGEQSFQRRHLFAPVETTQAEFAWKLAQAAVIAMVMSRLGMSWGRWMRSVVR